MQEAELPFEFRTRQLSMFVEASHWRSTAKSLAADFWRINRKVVFEWMSKLRRLQTADLAEARQRAAAVEPELQQVLQQSGSSSSSIAAAFPAAEPQLRVAHPHARSRQSLIM